MWVRRQLSELPGMRRRLAGRTQRQLWPIPRLRSLPDLCRQSEDLDRRATGRQPAPAPQPILTAIVPIARETSIAHC